MYAWVVILIIVAIAIAILLRYCGNTSNGFVRAYNSVVQGTSVQTVRAIYNRAREADPFIAGEILRYFAPQATKAAIVSYTAAINDLQNHEDYNYRIDNIRDYGDEMHHLIVGDIEVLRAKIRKHRERRLKDQKKDNKIEDHITHPIRPQSVHDSSAVNMVAATVDALNHKPVRNTAALIDIRRAIQNLSADKREHALSTLDRIETSDTHIDRYEKSEIDILIATWERSLIPENAANRANIQEAILLALSDSVQDGIVVCAMGRATNIISALGGVDHDAKMGIILDTTAIRNMCYELAAKLRDTNRADRVEAEITEAYGKMLKKEDLLSIIQECKDALE